MNKLLFPTSVVGSLPRPAFVLDLINDRPPLSAERYSNEMQAAVRYAVAMQEHAGLDVLTDGEWWRKSYIGVIAELAHGFELGTAPDGRPMTVVVDKLSPKTPGFIAREATFLKTITNRLIKSTLPSPALLGERMWHPEKSAKAYPNRDDFVRDCVPILRRELELVRDAGADIVQIDDPHLCLFVDHDVRGKYTDPDAAADFAVDMVNEVVSGISGVSIAVHLCRRAGGRARGEVCHGGGYGYHKKLRSRLPRWAHGGRDDRLERDDLLRHRRLLRRGKNQKHALGDPRRALRRSCDVPLLGVGFKYFLGINGKHTGNNSIT